MPDPNQKRHEARNRQINDKLHGHQKKSIVGNGFFHRPGTHAAGAMCQHKDGGCDSSNHQERRNHREADQEHIQQVNFGAGAVVDRQRRHVQGERSRFRLRNGVHKMHR